MNNSAPAIRNIVFDIGWVFVRLNYRPMLELLRARGVEADDLHSFLARASLEDHESGRLHGLGLLERIASLTREPVSVDELYGHWVNMLELEPAMVELAHRLSEAYRVYLLSNIGDLHWAHLSREYRFHRIGHGALPSYLAGVMKPHEGIYAEAERRFALEPAATVFIDDRSDNVATARGRGWQGIVHGGYQSTVEALRGLKVAC
jgi:HAD superfamily hydrolase (TIGR01509 family)